MFVFDIDISEFLGGLEIKHRISSSKSSLIDFKRKLDFLLLKIREVVWLLAVRQNQQISIFSTIEPSKHVQISQIIEILKFITR